MRFIRIFLALVALTGAAFAQVNTPSVDDLLNDVAAGTTGKTVDQGVLIPQVFSRDTLNEEGIKALEQSLTSYYQYRIDGFAHRSRVFEWQLFSTKVIFVMVLLIVVAGLYFSWMQFHSGRDPNDMKESTLEFGKAGIRITSPVLGVIILSLSLAFFYLYLVHIYPISDAL